MPPGYSKISVYLASKPFILTQLFYHESEYVADLTDSLKLPDWFNPEREDTEQLRKLLDWCVDVSTLAFTRSQLKNDFFILHFITGFFSFRLIY